MFEDFEIPVIETYTQLACVLAVLAAVVLAVWFGVRTLRRTRRRVDQTVKLHSPMRGAEPRTSKEFDTVAGVVTERTERATAIGAKQAAAAVKIDSTELAIDRLRGELAEIMQIPAPRGTAARQN